MSETPSRTPTEIWDETWKVKKLNIKGREDSSGKEDGEGINLPEKEELERGVKSRRKT